MEWELFAWAGNLLLVARTQAGALVCLQLTFGACHVPPVLQQHISGPDAANRIFIGGLPYYLNDEQVGLASCPSDGSQVAHRYCLPSWRCSGSAQPWLAFKPCCTLRNRAAVLPQPALQCRELLGAFGEIKTFDLIKDRQTGQSKG